MVKKRYFILILIFIILLNLLYSHTVYAEWLADSEGTIYKFSDFKKHNGYGIEKEEGEGKITSSGATTNEDLLENLDDYKPGDIGEEAEFTKKVGVILGVLNIVGAIISVVTIILIGFKYMLGSVEEKASYKKVMMPWLIGAFLVFTVTTVPNMLYNVGKSITSKGSGGGGSSQSGSSIKGPPSDIFFETELRY